VQVEVGSGLERGARRELKAEAAITLGVTTVSTPEGLRDAVQRGDPDIVITEHLDLTTLELLQTSPYFKSPLGDIEKTRSIRVRNSLDSTLLKTRTYAVFI
jgi:hypothetical protein